MVDEVLDTQPHAHEEEALAVGGVTLNRHERRKWGKMQRRAEREERRR
jgi:hypothetical protein